VAKTAEGRGVEAIDDRTEAGKKAKAWLKLMPEMKGGRSSAIGKQRENRGRRFICGGHWPKRSYIGPTREPRDFDQQTPRPSADHKRAVRDSDQSMAADK